MRLAVRLNKPFTVLGIGDFIAGTDQLVATRSEDRNHRRLVIRCYRLDQCTHRGFGRREILLRSVVGTR